MNPYSQFNLNPHTKHVQLTPNNTTQHRRMKTKEPPMTTAMFKAKLRAQGKTIGQWADDNNFDRLIVYRTLAGTLKGNFGKSHDILVAAGIKLAAPDSLAA